ncbi:hypothetical protein [Marinicella sp. W31]|uniref:hypothetical protein n=1 Tax=Marinicella sp. W31 TaxID=3023713 RepID=UPI003756E8C1
MKKLILLMILLVVSHNGVANAQMGLSSSPDDLFGSCDDNTDEEGNSDWIDVNYIGPRDDPGCRASDPIARYISILISEVIGDGLEYDHAYVLDSQPKNVISFSLALSNLLAQLENDKHVTFYEYIIDASRGTQAAIMSLQIEKEVLRKKNGNWLLTVNWLNTWYPSQQIIVPQDATYVAFDVIWEQNFGLEYSELNLFVEAENLDIHLTHPNKFSINAQPMQTHIGLISAELMPPVGDLIEIREDLNP